MKAAARVLAVAIIVAAVFFALTRVLLPRLRATGVSDLPPATLAVGATLPSLDSLAWTGPAPGALRGATIVLAEFSDTDPACVRALPAVEGWAEAYARYGVRVVGVDEPDFAFAADTAVTAALARRLGLTFPIALDGSYRLRDPLGDPAGGPRLLLADGAGTVRATALGPGELAAFESALRGAVRRGHPDVAFPADPARAGASAAPAPAPRTIHLGIGRVAEGPLANAAPGSLQPFTAQFRFQIEGKEGVPYPVGWWTPSAEGIAAGRGGAETFVALRYDAGALWAVMSPPRDQPARVWILRDEQWPARETLGDDARQDSRGAAYVDVTEPRLYAIARATPGQHVVKLSPDARGLTIHALVLEPLDAGRSRR